MPDVRPFPGIRYTTSDLRDLICPPYDIISPTLQDRLYDRHEHNAIRLELAKGDGLERYENAAASFGAWTGDGTLTSDDPSLYVYRQDFVGPAGDRRTVVGVIGALSLEPFGENSGVLPHERTMPGPIQDRLALLRACPVNVSPIFAVYRGGERLAPFYSTLENRPPVARVQDDDGILHRLWAITAAAEVETLQSVLRPGPLVIADGHHRYETALAFREEQSGSPGGHDAIMCFSVDADGAGLVVLPYHRAFRTDVNADEIAARLTRDFGARSPTGPERDAETSGATFTVVLPNVELEVALSASDVASSLAGRADAWRSLDVVALHEVLLPRLLPEGTTEMTFSKDPDEIRRLVKEGWSGGVLMRALTAAQVVDVASSGERMPQKASYFWPKAVTGLVFRALD